MKKLAVFVVALAALFTTTIDTAEAAPCDSIQCRNTNISRLYAAENGNVYITPADGGLSNLACTPSGGQYLTLKPSHANYDQIFKMLLSSQLYNTPIWVRTVSGTPDCTIAYLVLEN